MVQLANVRLILAVVVLFAGCDSAADSIRPDNTHPASRPVPGSVIVTDVAGQPIAGATVAAVALSTTTGPNLTDTNGKTQLPGNIQGVKWVRVSATGFETVQVEVPQNWPLRIQLQPNAD